MIKIEFSKWNNENSEIYLRIGFSSSFDFGHFVSLASDSEW